MTQITVAQAIRMWDLRIDKIREHVMAVPEQAAMDADVRKKFEDLINEACDDARAGFIDAVLARARPRRADA